MNFEWSFPFYIIIDNCLEVTKLLKVGWLSTLCCWEAAVHTLECLDYSLKNMDVKLMMMMMNIATTRLSTKDNSDKNILCHQSLCNSLIAIKLRWCIDKKHHDSISCSNF